MVIYPSEIENLIDKFNKLPGIGRKTSEKFVFYLLRENPLFLNEFSASILNLKKNLNFCQKCGNFSGTKTICEICADERRDKSLLCIIEDIQDLAVIESTGEYHGQYHVLGGQINPLEGITPEKLNIQKLIDRVKAEKFSEIILALNPDIQGEATSLYLVKLFKPLNVKFTKLARGLAMGSDLEYTDETTLTNALKGRQEVK
ncbi:MAG TPA: recombination mediator RecR [Candidatus Bipolaricaulota bacterium]|nr:recombination mediator RecR [Candidatus Bipolaricaulota bacterium]